MPIAPYNDHKQYFVPGFCISRNVIYSHIQFYLGPDATVRQYSYQGRDGYLVSAPGPALTKSQIEDIQTLSTQYEEQQAARMITSSCGAEADMYINRPIQLIRRMEGEPDSYGRNRVRAGYSAAKR